MTHGPNYSRPPPELVDNEEEYEVEKILDSRHHGRGHALQYLVKWKGYPDLDNKWVNKRNVHTPEVIREFQNRNSTKEMHISQGLTSKSTIPLHLFRCITHSTLPMSDAVNTYYLRTPACIFRAELNSGLITLNEARELCAKKYV